MVQKEEKKRSAWLDNVKMYAMLWVILGHIMTIIIKTNNDLPGNIIEHFIVAFNMPLFMIISGYSNYNAFNRINNIDNLYIFIKKTIIHILLPVITFCLMSLTPNFIFSPFWFLNMLLYLMLGFAIIHYIIYAIFKKHILIASIILFIICFLGINKIWIGEMCTYYVIGLLCRRFKIFEHPHKILFPLLIFIGCILFILIWINGDYAIKENSFYHSGLFDLLDLGLAYLWIERQILGIILSIGMMGVFLNFDGRYTLFSKMGSYILSFYLFHAIMLRLFRNETFIHYFHHTTFYQFFNNSTSLRWCGVFIIFFLMTAICWKLICICQKWKWTKLLCLGKQL